MEPESKGKAWFGKFCNKLEALLDDVDSFTSQTMLCLKPDNDSDPQGSEFVRADPKEVAVDHSSVTYNVASPICECPFDPPYHKNFDIPEHVLSEEPVQGQILKPSDLQGSESFKSERNEAAEDSSSVTYYVKQDHDRRASPVCECPFNPLGHQNFFIQEHVLAEESVQVQSLAQEHSFELSDSSLSDQELPSTSQFLEAYCDTNLTSASTLGDEELIIPDDESQIINTCFLEQEIDVLEQEIDDWSRDVVSPKSPSKSFLDDCNDHPVLAVFHLFTKLNDSKLNEPLATKIPDVHVQEFVAKMTSSDADNVINEESDVTPLDINALDDIELREDPSINNNTMHDVGESLLHAVSLRTKKLRSFKRKILDAFTSKRRIEKEYEQLAIWFGDAEMSSDLVTEEDSQELESEDSQWELI